MATLAQLRTYHRLSANMNVDRQHPKRMSQADDRLSRLISEMNELAFSLNFAYLEANMLGAPSECDSLIREAFITEARDIIDSYQTTAIDVAKEVAERTTRGWLYKQPCAMLIGDLEEEEAENIFAIAKEHSDFYCKNR